MTDFLSRCEEQLLSAARSRAAARPVRPLAWRRWRRRPGALVALGLVVLTAPAIAATTVWRPLLGTGTHAAPTATMESPPADQLRMLGVLRRSQTSADRSAPTLYGLSYLSTSIDGVRTASVRLLHVADDGRGVVLVPVERYGLSVPSALPGSTAGSVPLINGLCLFAADDDHGQSAGGGFGCYSTDQVRNGVATAALGHQFYGLVPDGVAKVEVDFDGGRRVTVSTQDNFFIADAPSDAIPVPVRTSWYGIQGQLLSVISRPGGALGRPPVSPSSSKRA